MAAFVNTLSQAFQKALIKPFLGAFEAPAEGGNDAFEYDLDFTFEE